VTMAMTPAMPEAPPTTAAPVTRTVEITDAAVTPGQLVVAPGTRVMWANVGRNRHTSTADDGRWDSGALIPGEDFSISAPAEPGTYAYHCRFHAYIRGSLTVSLVALSAPAPVTVGGAGALRATSETVRLPRM